MNEKKPVGFEWRSFLKDNGFFLLIFFFLVIFPHLMGWLTGDSPFGRLRGERFIMQGQSTFWQSVLIEMFALSILVMSYNLMFGFTGVISFGHALFFGLGGYITGIFLQSPDLLAKGKIAFAIEDPVAAFIIGVLLVMLATGVVSLLMGLVTLRLKGIYFAIFTLAIAEMAWIYVGRWEVTNGEDGLTINLMPEWIDPSRNRLALYYIAMIAFVLCFLLIRRLVNSPAGTVFKAIRDNEDRAQAIGYYTLRYKLLAITVAGMMAGIAGIIHGILNKSARPEMMSVAYTVDALLMSIIGGVGTFTGPVIGASGLHLADTVFRDAEIMLGQTVINVGDSWNLILGFIFILVVLVFPYGVVGTFQRWQYNRKREAIQRALAAEEAANLRAANES